MNLTAEDRDKLLVSVAAMVARARLARGVRLNHPEAVALITDTLMERARDGHAIQQVVAAGRAVLNADQVMEGVAAMIEVVQVEATFPDGSRLITVRNPIR